MKCFYFIKQKTLGIAEDMDKLDIDGSDVDENDDEDNEPIGVGEDEDDAGGKCI